VQLVTGKSLFETQDAESESSDDVSGADMNRKPGERRNLLVGGMEPSQHKAIPPGAAPTLRCCLQLSFTAAVC
jgi:hypothetical protein